MRRIACACPIATVLTIACTPKPEAPPRVAAPPPATSAATSSTPPPAATAPPGPVAEEPGDPTAMEPYRVNATVGSSEATTKEDVTVGWTIDGGPRSKAVTPRVRVSVEWRDIPKPGAKKPPAPTTQSFPPEADPCTAAPLGASVAFPMQAKKNATITVDVVACRDGKPIEATRASANTRVTWVSPYVETIEVPAVLVAGATTQGTIRFRGLETATSPGAPPKVIVRSSNPGVTITKQPAVAPASTFDIAVKPTASGEVKLTAEHVNTDGQGKILGAITRATTVRVRAAKP